jgi:murein DD-endopeptidase MepM/ murein hydrolase activator NlpD
MDRLRALFPEREFFMRSEGQVRFIRISSRLQIGAAAIVAALLLVWVGTMAALAAGRFTASHDRASLLHREAKVATAERRVRAYRKGVKAVEADLARRQDFIEKMVQAHLGELPADLQQDESASAGGKDPKVRKISMAAPGATGLAQIAARQRSFVERLTRFADRRSEQDAAQIRKLGLNPRAMLASVDGSSAEGGPFQPLATGANGAIDPRFRRLGVSLARMDALERGLAGIPQVLPANLEFVSSGCGYRADPFTGAAAFHAGIDFPGPVGTPVYAAARGRVSFVGQRSGYGNCIEIDHGNGLLTRYAHLAGFAARVGEHVAAGARIGAIGSTGRSTGPHLHFEVRVNDRPVNPRPFLEAATRVQHLASAG